MNNYLQLIKDIFHTSKLRVKLINNDSIYVTNCGEYKDIKYEDGTKIKSKFLLNHIPLYIKSLTDDEFIESKNMFFNNMDDIEYHGNKVFTSINLYKAHSKKPKHNTIISIYNELDDIDINDITKELYLEIKKIFNDKSILSILDDSIKNDRNIEETFRRIVKYMNDVSGKYRYRSFIYETDSKNLIKIYIIRIVVDKKKN